MLFFALQMEFSFGTKTWLPGGPLQDRQSDAAGYALGLHVPGFFDKFLNINKCLLQSEPANKVCDSLCISLKQWLISSYQVFVTIHELFNVQKNKNFQCIFEPRGFATSLEPFGIVV